MTTRTEGTDHLSRASDEARERIIIDDIEDDKFEAIESLRTEIESLQLELTWMKNDLLHVCGEGCDPQAKQVIRDKWKGRKWIK